MPLIGKQRRANRSKAFRTRRDRFGGNSKPKPFTLSGKLKSNNNLLAKALSEQKQESQLLFTQKIELTKQLQALTTACNKRDLAISTIQKTAKEILPMLVTLTNHVTTTLMACKEFNYKPESNTPRPSSASATRRESTRRLSIKSPARGVVKPMVSGYTITKPTINLRRINMQRVNTILDLSDIVESSPERLNNSSVNISHTNTAAITTANRLGYEGERRRRLPERIPVEYVQAEDDEGETLARQETMLSASLSGRLSDSLSRKYSDNSLIGQMRSPSVSLCDVSKLLQNSQTVNVRMLRDSRENGDFSRPSNTPQNSPLQNNNENTLSVNITVAESGKTRKSRDKTQQPLASPKRVQVGKSTKVVKKKKRNSEIDPLEGPSWLLNGSVANASTENIEEERTVDIFRRKRIGNTKKLDSSYSENETENNSDNDSMEFTECVNPIRRAVIIPTSSLVHENKNDNSNLADHSTQDDINGDNSLLDPDDNQSDQSEDLDEQCTNIYVNRSSQFVTDRRRQYIEEDDEDDDTIMLKITKQPPNFNINDFSLPVVSCPIITPAEPSPSDSEPEVTRTIQAIPQNHIPEYLGDENVRDRVSNFNSLQLPRLEDESVKTKKSKRPLRRKHPKKNLRFHEPDSSESDCESKSKKKPAKLAKTTNVKDPSSAKVVLQKLNDVRMKVKSITPDRSVSDTAQEINATNERISETGHSELFTDSNSSTHNVSEKGRLRRQKAPTNFEEPSLKKKLRR